jgi:cytochrome c biogenesis protein CcdA
VTIFGRAVSDQQVSRFKFAVVAFLVSVAIVFTLAGISSTLLSTTTVENPWGSFTLS